MGRAARSFFSNPPPPSFPSFFSALKFFEGRRRRRVRSSVVKTFLSPASFLPSSDLTVARSLLSSPFPLLPLLGFQTPIKFCCKAFSQIPSLPTPLYHHYHAASISAAALFLSSLFFLSLSFCDLTDYSKKEGARKNRSHFKERKKGGGALKSRKRGKERLSNTRK